MDDNSQLQQYISRQRAAGITDEVVRDNLLSAGWPSETIDKNLPPANASDSPQVPANQPVKKQSTNQRLMLISAITVFFVTAGGLYINSLRQPDAHEVSASEPADSWKDKNYSLDLAEGWRADNDNAPGAGRNTFKNEAFQARVVVYATPQNDSIMSPLERALKNLQTDSSEITINRVETVLINDQASTIHLVTADYSNTRKNFAYFYVPYSGTDYFIEATGSNEQWSSAVNDIIAMMKSFKPANKDIRRAH